jgi:hypothetical protein
LNIYRTKFVAQCPSNGLAIAYSLEIQTGDVIKVEDIIAAADSVGVAFHEDIADQLGAKFGGSQRLKATHHGVDIETIRPHVAHWAPSRT